MKSLPIDERKIGRMLFIGTLLILSIVPELYSLRWLSLLFLAISLWVFLVWEDIKLPEDKRNLKKETIRRKDEYNRVLDSIQNVRKGGNPRVLEEELLEILYVLTRKSYQDLRSNPPRALKVFYSSTTPYEGIKRALKVLEEEIHED